MGRGGKKPRVYPKPPPDARLWLFHVKTEPAPITPSQSPQCPLLNAASRILSREESQDGHCDVTYLVEITHHPDNAARTREETVHVDVSRILDYVSPRELERFENADFRRLTEAENVAHEAEREEEARQRLVRNSRPKPGKTYAAPAAAEAQRTRGRPPGSRGTRGCGCGLGRPRGRGGLALPNNAPAASLDENTGPTTGEGPFGLARTANVFENEEEDTDSTDIEPPPGFHRASLENSVETEASEEDEPSSPPPSFHRAVAVEREENETETEDDGNAPTSSFSRVPVVTGDEDEEQDDIDLVAEQDEDEEKENQDAPAPGQHKEEKGIAPPPGFHRVPSKKDEDYEEDDIEDKEVEDNTPPPSHRGSKSAREGKKRPIKKMEPTLEKLTKHYTPGFHQLTPGVPAQEEKPKWRKANLNLFNIKNAVPGFFKFQFITNSALPSTSKTAGRKSSVAKGDDEEEIPESSMEEEEDEVIEAKDVPDEYVKYDEEISDSAASEPHQSQEPKPARQSRPGIHARETTRSPTQNADAENNGHRHKRRRTETTSRSRSVQQRSRSRPARVVPEESAEEVDHLDKIEVDPAEDNQDQEDVYVVEKVLSHQIDKSGKTWYLVKWEGYDKAEDWLTKEELAEAPEVVSQYHAGLKPRARKKEITGTGSKRKGR